MLGCSRKKETFRSLHVIALESKGSPYANKQAQQPSIVIEDQIPVANDKEIFVKLGVSLTLWLSALAYNCNSFIAIHAIKPGPMIKASSSISKVGVCTYEFIPFATLLVPSL
jgi:hypothetical protein